MRKRQLSIVKEMSGLLKQAHESVLKVISEKVIEENNLNAVFSLLSQCQSAAINMGNLIEESEGEGFITVKYLEDYCELVFSINEEIQKDSGTNNPDKVYKKLNKMLQKIDNSIAHDIPLKREAVFLPYKASMWDSLESVWEAADADPDCDAYVIPIPYFDKNPDGSVREEHYEGDLFPENVPVTHYSEFDFGKHHPDMIFIHNPYDYGNLVTTIHPFFYAENMKKVTDCLVYIPYFATSGGMGEDKSWCPVYDYADYIVIQSESYRQYYSKDIPDEKILPFGSPKFDKVIRKCQNPPTPPEEWVKRARGRKVMFYNTSLNCMLQDTPKYLKKMQYVFESFKNHPEYCLLWRPHPLFESTLKAMRLNCLEVYRALRENFKEEEGWILDDTPCVEDTIAFCDGYVGDMYSSIVALFGVAGKRIFILNDKIFGNNSIQECYTLPYLTNVGEKEKDKFYVSAENVLYRLKENDICERYLDISNSLVKSMYQFAYRYKDKIVLIPGLGQDFKIISNNGKVETINIVEQKKCHWSFHHAYTYNNYIILIPHDYTALVVLNLDKGEISYLDGVKGFFVSKESDDTLLGCTWFDKGWLFLLSYDSKKMIKINIETLEYEEKRTSIDFKVRKAIVLTEGTNEVWLTNAEGPFISRYNYVEDKCEIYHLYIEGLEAVNPESKQKTEEGYFGNIALIDGQIVVSPFNGNKYIALNRKTGEYKEYFPEIVESDIENTKEYKIIDLSRVPRLDGEGFRGEKLYVPINQSKEDSKKYREYGAVSRYCNCECEYNTLDDYLKNYNEYDYSKTDQIEKYKDVNAAPNGDCGERIFRYLIE